MIAALWQKEKITTATYVRNKSSRRHLRAVTSNAPDQLSFGMRGNLSNGGACRPDLGGPNTGVTLGNVWRVQWHTLVDTSPILVLRCPVGLSRATRSKGA